MRTKHEKFVQFNGQFLLGLSVLKVIYKKDKNGTEGKRFF
jgi:hypothetical protein